LRPGKSENDFVFTRPDGLPVISFRGLWKNACISAGWPWVAASRSAAHHGAEMLRAWVPEKVIMAVCGWKTRSVFDRYSIIRQDDIALAMEKSQRADKLQNSAAEINFGDHPVTIDVPASVGPVN
jgi:hypothetical protein